MPPLNWTFSPCVAVARDERWGRTYESFGEDPGLQVLLTGPYVRGLQSIQTNGCRILACAKHYLADGGAVFGTGERGLIDRGDCRLPEERLRKIHLPGYREAVKAGVFTVMASFSSWNGVKMHANRRLLTGVLKNELGFSGFVVSDWDAIEALDESYPECIRIGVDAGIDMFMVPTRWKEFYEGLLDLARRGTVPAERVDDAVLRILRVKFASGLFDRPFPAMTDVVPGNAAHRRVAREAVRKSLVLLKNTNRILPLKKTARILLAGSGANDMGKQCGGWTISWQGDEGDTTPGTTIGQAIKMAVYRNAGNPIGSVSMSMNKDSLQKCDVAVIVASERPYAEGRGDDPSPSIQPEDRLLVKKAKKAGLPVVLVIVSGRPLLLGGLEKDADAIVAAWLPGTEGGGAADVLFGDDDFSGRLPVSWPRSSRQLPFDADAAGYDPLFPFGYGLSYGLK